MNHRKSKGARPLKRKVHVDGKAWSWEFGVQNGYDIVRIRTPDGRATYTCAPEVVHSHGDERKSYVTPGSVKSYIEGHLAD